MKTQRYGDMLYRHTHSPIPLPLARDDFKNKRLNGDEKRDAPDSWIDRIPDDASITWVKGGKNLDWNVYGELESDGYYHYECRYDATPDDLEWMRKTDCNYLKRILQEGQLKALEPDVYYLCLISMPRNVGNAIAKDFDIGRWWRTQVDKPNIADLLQSAQTVYETRRVLEAKCEMLPELSNIIGEYVTVAPDKKEEKEVAVAPKPSSCSSSGSNFSSSSSSSSFQNLSTLTAASMFSTISVSAVATTTETNSTMLVSSPNTVPANSNFACQASSNTSILSVSKNDIAIEIEEGSQKNSVESEQKCCRCALL